MRSKVIAGFVISCLLALFFEACQNQQDINYARYYANGKSLYDQHCQNCHNADGSGLGALIPPLNVTVFLKNNRNKLACIIKHGFNDSISINGKTYHEQMPASHQLADMDVAAIVTYITNTFGNKQGLYDVEVASKNLKDCVN
jgi:mono/diheme cytochrome c family protein